MGQAKGYDVCTLFSDARPAPLGHRYQGSAIQLSYTPPVFTFTYILLLCNRLINGWGVYPEKVFGS